MLSVKRCDIFKYQKNIAQSKKILLKENITDNCKIQKKSKRKCEHFLVRDFEVNFE